MSENKDIIQLKKEIESKKQDRLAKNKKRIFRQIVFALIIVVIIIVVFSVSFRNDDNPEGQKTVAESKASVEKEIMQSETQAALEAFAPSDVSAKASQGKKTVADNLSELNNELESAVSCFEGEWSVYVKNLDTDKSISVNNQQMYAASLIKLFAMAAAYQQINDGILQQQDIYDTIYKMITVSDNDCFNSVVWTLGKYYISQWCTDNKYTMTSQCHGLYPADNADGLQTYAGYNMTSADDCGKLLESIYNGGCISKEYSEQMLDILSHQELLNKIPTGLPENVKYANKTGETDDVCHDAAIVYSEGADYILVVMVNNPGNAYSNTDDVVKISELVYNYFNK